MNDTGQHHRHPPQASYRPRDFSYVWIVPLLALLVAGWMGWSSWHSDGPTIHIAFQKTDGVEANRTQIRHKGVVLGTVTALTPSKDFAQVVVSAHMGAIAEPYLTQGAQFWVVHPRVSVGGISDLSTLVSGAYIELSPGNGAATHDFAGLEDPVAVDPQQTGKSFVLHAPQLGSLERGSPLYFHGVPVGEVTSFELNADKDVDIHIFVRTPYDALVLNNTTFWNASGIGITAGAAGIKIAAQSLQAIVQGGILFDVPGGAKNGTPVAADTAFMLYADRDAADNSVFTKTIAYRLRFTGSVQGLDVGSPVYLLGNRIGIVNDVHIAIDEDSGDAASYATVELQPERMRLAGGKNGIEAEARATFRQMVKRGLRAKIASGNLLTGQKNIGLSFVADAAPATINGDGATPDFPTVPSDDIDHLIQDAHGVLTDADHMIREVGPQIGPMLNSIRNATDQISGQINTNDGQGGISGTLEEVKQAARAVRELADYIDAHPEAIVRGKGETP